MPSRGLHGPTPAHGRAMSKQPVPPKGPKKPKKHGFTDASWRLEERDQSRAIQMLGEIVAELHRIAEAIIDSRPRPGPLPEPSEFVSGGFHRRSGDIYQSVAEPGTPNAGVTDGDDPSGTV